MSQRIVSLVPSQTELLAYLGLDAEVVGITRFCIHPAHWYRTKQRIGGTKDFRVDQIAALRPDLILANKEENTQEGIAQLATQHEVWVSDVNTFADALSMIQTIGGLTQRRDAAADLINRLETALAQHLPALPTQRRLRVAYLIWRNPYMVAANDTFIQDMMTNIVGLDNVFAHLSRYPVVTLPQLAAERPDLVLLSSEPYPFRERHIAELREILGSAVRIELTDGEMWSWYGSRLLQAIPYLSMLRKVWGSA
ncbi:MAG: ABC transporter substrate-binding protein [Chitinophagales bacterium]|nr:ABC transporter substrate-binding protein [Chitinophagales bacterium]